MNQITVLDAVTISRTLEQSALLHRLLPLVLADRPLAALLDEALDQLFAVSWLAHLPGGGVFLADETGTALTLAAEHGLGPEIAGRCARIPFAPPAGDGTHAEMFDAIAPDGHYTVPITAPDAMLGLLLVRLPEGRRRDAGEIDFLTSVGELLALLIAANRRAASAARTEARLGAALAETDSLMRTIRQHTIFSQASPDGTITEVNDAFCAISGYSRDELVGAPHRINNSGRHSAEFWADFWQKINNGEVWRGEICNRRKDGSLYWVDSIVMPVCDSEGRVERFVSLRRDVTERRHADEQLARMGRILDDSSNEIYVFDASTLKFTLVNRGARENLGYGSEELAGLTPIDLDPDLAAHGFAELIAPLLAGKIDKQFFETVHRRKDGSTYPVEVSLHYAADENPPVFVAIVQDITQRKSNDARIEQLAFYDPLTGLANRALMIDRLRQAVARAERYGQTLSLLFMDLNRFKEINDTRGHGVGDAALAEVARRFRAVMRRSETLARIGGDEFVAIVENVTRANVIGIIHRLKGALAEPIVVEGKAHNLSVSVGVADFPKDSTQPESLLQLADIAMYEAKSQGGGYRFYDPEMGRAVAKRHEIAVRLSQAVAEDRLELFFQPFVSLETGALEGAEALLRWRDPEWGFVRPDEFIPIAAERRMLADIGNWVIDRACRQLRDWREAGLCGLDRLAINVAAEQMESAAILHRIEAALRRNETPAQALEVEITESSMMTDPDRAAETLRRLKDLGLRISIDDFGTGYSSLAYLKQFATDKLKIDMSFVRDLLDDPNTQAIIAATIAMARSLGLKVLAEGVETEAQAQRLRELRCDQAQGYLFGKPVPADDFARTWLRPAPGKAPATE